MNVIYYVIEIVPPENVIISALSPPHESVITASWQTHSIQRVKQTVISCTPCDPEEVR